MITIWHNPRCSKSRQTLALLQDRGLDISERRYLEDAPSREELEALQKLLNVPVIQMMRPKDALFRELGLSKDADDGTLLDAMSAHPKLIERPVVFANGKAALGRPPEAVLDTL